MADILIFCYGVLAVFVLSSVTRSKKEGRQMAPTVAVVGYGIASMSATLSILLAGWALIAGMAGVTQLV